MTAQAETPAPFRAYAGTHPIESMAAYGLVHPGTMLVSLILNQGDGRPFTTTEIVTKLIEAQGLDPGWTTSLDRRVEDYCLNGLVRAGLAYATRTQSTKATGAFAFGATEQAPTLGAAAIAVHLDEELQGQYSSQDVFGFGKAPTSDASGMPSSLLRFRILERVHNAGKPLDFASLREGLPRTKHAVYYAARDMAATGVVRILRRASEGGRLPEGRVEIVEDYAKPIGAFLDGLQAVRDDSAFRQQAAERARHIISNPYAVAYLMSKARAHSRHVTFSLEDAVRQSDALHAKVAGWITLQEEIALDPKWSREAACAKEDGEIFFPLEDYKPRYEDVEAAKHICNGCRVKTECLHHAMTQPEEFGIWAGLTPDERRNIAPGLRLLLGSMRLA